MIFKAELQIVPTKIIWSSKEINVKPIARDITHNLKMTKHQVYLFEFQKLNNVALESITSYLSKAIVCHLVV